MLPDRGVSMGSLLLVLVALLAGSAAPPHSAQGGTGCVTPRDACKFFDAYLAAFNDRDWEAFRATFDDNITVMFDRPAPPDRRDGRIAVEEFFRRVFPAPGQSGQLPPPLKPEQLLAQDLGDVVVVSFHIRTPGEFARRTVVLHKTPAGWRVAHIHASSDLAAR